jgi:hypothetical protein
VGFCPYEAVSSFPKEHRSLFLWLGCWTAKITVTLDTLRIVPKLVESVHGNWLTVDQRDSYYWTETRRESGEEHREFAELLKRDREEFDRRKKWHTRMRSGRTKRKKQR